MKEDYIENDGSSSLTLPLIKGEKCPKTEDKIQTIHQLLPPLTGLQASLLIHFN
jgi:hypothetical protein